MTERSSRMLSELHPLAQPVMRAFISSIDSKLGSDQYIIFEGRRSLKTQEAYYAQGRENLEAVNEKRREAGLYLLRSERDNYVITWTLKSKHLDGFALDVLPVDGAGNPTWDLGHYRRQFEIIRDCGKAAGLVCGAEWPDTPDWPHYEYRGNV